MNFLLNSSHIPFHEHLLLALFLRLPILMCFVFCRLLTVPFFLNPPSFFSPYFVRCSGSLRTPWLSILFANYFRPCQFASPGDGGVLSFGQFCKKEVSHGQSFSPRFSSLGAIPWFGQRRFWNSLLDLWVLSITPHVFFPFCTESINLFGEFIGYMAEYSTQIAAKTPALGLRTEELPTTRGLTTTHGDSSVDR